MTVSVVIKMLKEYVRKFIFKPITIKRIMVVERKAGTIGTVIAEFSDIEHAKSFVNVLRELSENFNNMYNNSFENMKYEIIVKECLL